MSGRNLAPALIAAGVGASAGSDHCTTYLRALQCGRRHELTLQASLEAFTSGRPHFRRSAARRPLRPRQPTGVVNRPRTSRIKGEQCPHPCRRPAEVHGQHRVRVPPHTIEVRRSESQ